MTVLVIGLGHEDRGDDAIGPVVAAEVSAQVPPGVGVVAHEDPMDLVLHWGEHSWAVVVDAVVSGADPGTLTVLELGADDPGARDWSRLALGGTHAFGLSEAVELSRSLDRLPERVTLVGIEAADVTPGAGLSDRVARAVPEAVAVLRRLLSAATVGGVHVPR